MPFPPGFPMCTGARLAGSWRPPAKVAAFGALLPKIWSMSRCRHCTVSGAQVLWAVPYPPRDGGRKSPLINQLPTSSVCWPIHRSRTSVSPCSVIADNPAGSFRDVVLSGRLRSFGTDGCVCHRGSGQRRQLSGFRNYDLSH